MYIYMYHTYIYIYMFTHIVVKQKLPGPTNEFKGPTDLSKKVCGGLCCGACGSLASTRMRPRRL